MSDLNVKELSRELVEAIEGLRESDSLQETGVATRVSDGVVWIYGLRGAGYGEVLEVETDSGTPARAFALNLFEDEIGAVLLDSETGVRAGAKVRLSVKPLEVP